MLKTIEQVVIEYLNTQFTDIEAHGEEPLQTRDKYFIVEKTGGGYENKINSATIAIKSYAKTLAEAAELNDMLKATMLNIVNQPEVSSCELNSDYDYTDTTKKKYRYQAVFDLVYFIFEV